MSVSTYLGFFAFWFLASIPLGPNAINSIRYGAALDGIGWIWAPLGTTVAAILFCAIVLMGFGIFVTERPWLQAAIRLAGGCYLVYLGVRILLAARRRKAGGIEVDGALAMGSPFRDGFLVSMTNPKPIILYSSVLSSYLTVNDMGSTHNIIILTITIATVFIVYMTYGLLGKTAAFIFSHDRIFNVIQIAAGWSFLFLAAAIFLELAHQYGVV